MSRWVELRYKLQVSYANVYNRKCLLYDYVLAQCCLITILVSTSPLSLKVGEMRLEHTILGQNHTIPSDNNKRASAGSTTCYVQYRNTGDCFRRPFLSCATPL